MQTVNDVIRAALKPSTLAAIVGDIDAVLEDVPATPASESMRDCAYVALVGLLGETQALELINFYRN